MAISVSPGYTKAMDATNNCIRIGVPWDQQFNWRDGSTGATLDLTGYSARACITSGNTQGSGTLLEFTSIILAASSPNITISASDAATAALTATEDSWFWLTLTDGAGKDYTLVYGPCPIRYWGAP